LIEVDLGATRRRIKRLRRYVAANLLKDRSFLCPYRRECRRSLSDADVFRPATMSHVGHRFDLRLDGRDLRIVVVGQESGWPKGPDAMRKASKVSLAARYAAVHDDTGLGRRYYATPEHEGRNPHMRGTTSALRVVFGHGLGTNFAGEWVCPENDRPFHLFDGFALVNRLLCSAGPPGSSTGHPTRLMRDNCLEHFEATLSILQPTLVVLQGALVARSAEGALPVVRRRGEHSYTSDLNGQLVQVCVFSHPAAHGSQRWGNGLDAPYLKQVVVPTLQGAIEAL